MTVTYEDYLYHIDAMTLSDLMMMREIEAQQRANPKGSATASGGLELETVDDGR